MVLNANIIVLLLIHSDLLKIITYLLTLFNIIN